MIPSNPSRAENWFYAPSFLDSFLMYTGGSILIDFNAFSALLALHLTSSDKVKNNQTTRRRSAAACSRFVFSAVDKFYFSWFASKNRHEFHQLCRKMGESSSRQLIINSSIWQLFPTTKARPRDICLLKLSLVILENDVIATDTIVSNTTAPFLLTSNIRSRSFGRWRGINLFPLLLGLIFKHHYSLRVFRKPLRTLLLRKVDLVVICFDNLSFGGFLFLGVESTTNYEAKSP